MSLRSSTVYCNCSKTIVESFFSIEIIIGGNHNLVIFAWLVSLPKCLHVEEVLNSGGPGNLRFFYSWICNSKIFQNANKMGAKNVIILQLNDSEKIQLKVKNMAHKEKK